MISYEDSSFRDPAAFVFYKNGAAYRQINIMYKESYDLLMGSGLYRDLAERKWLIRHEEVEVESPSPGDLYKILKPEQVHFITYPYEWCFSQLKDVALLTLQIQKKALEKGMVLKDASAYNVHFADGRPVFIDTSSFEIYKENKPWAAYGQFCRNFIAPLLLMSYTDARLNQLFRVFNDGIPLDLTASILPLKAKLKPMVFMNICLHNRAERHLGNRSVSPDRVKLSKKNLEIMIDSMYSFVQKLTPKYPAVGWKDYYSDLSYSEIAFSSKKAIVHRFLSVITPGFVWDIGANTGEFSKIAAGMGIKTVAFDMDTGAVEKNYLQGKAVSEKNILPLVLDLTNPSPGAGWDNTERKAVKDRRLPDAAMALALIHHLTISKNVPFRKVAAFFGNLCRYLIIEFVPKGDPMAEKMLKGREDIFDAYTPERFEQEFKEYFNILEQEKVTDSGRVIYLMENSNSTK